MYRGVMLSRLSLQYAKTAFALPQLSSTCWLHPGHGRERKTPTRQPRPCPSLSAFSTFKKLELTAGGPWIMFTGNQAVQALLPQYFTWLLLQICWARCSCFFCPWMAVPFLRYHTTCSIRKQRLGELSVSATEDRRRVISVASVFKFKLLVGYTGISQCYPFFTLKNSSALKKDIPGYETDLG